MPDFNLQILQILRSVSNYLAVEKKETHIELKILQSTENPTKFDFDVVVNAYNLRPVSILRSKMYQ
jgi:hypothetical protein